MIRHQNFKVLFLRYLCMDDVFDNLFKHEILALIKAYKTEKDNLQVKVE